MGLGAGGKMKQKIYRDRHGVEVWDPENFGRVTVHLLNSAQFREVTGFEPPTTQVDAAAYAEAGLPWFDLYDEDRAGLAAAPALAGAKTIAQRDEERGASPAESGPIDAERLHVEKLWNEPPAPRENRSVASDNRPNLKRDSGAGDSASRQDLERNSMSDYKVRTCVDALSPVALRDRRRALTIAGVEAPSGPGPAGDCTHQFRVAQRNDAARQLHRRGRRRMRQTVERTAKQWEKFANLKLVFDSSPQAQIRVAFVQDGRSWSYIGTDNLNITALAPTMNFGWPLEEGTILHEFGHAIGLAHEHQSPLGGMLWNEPVVLRELAGPPNNWDEETIRFNVLDKYQANQIRGTAFDPQSIMLYAFPARWTTNGVSTNENNAISPTDLAFVGSKSMYPFPADGGTGAVVLAVAENSGAEGEIGKVGEVDLYQFIAKTAGTYTIETEGPTDVFMRLFGPNNQTSLVAEDDDSGSDSNARIIRQLSPGEYFVQVRHFSPTETGKYRVRSAAERTIRGASLPRAGRGATGAGLIAVGLPVKLRFKPTSKTRGSVCAANLH